MISFICSVVVGWLLLHFSPGVMPPEFREELREISPNNLYDMARVIAFYRRGMATPSPITRT